LHQWYPFSYAIEIIIIYNHVNNVNILNVFQTLDMKSQLRIHIVTIDHHIERITEPMINLRADKAYIIAHKENDAVTEFLKKTKDILKKHKIPAFVIYVDIWNLMACVEQFRKIIESEKNNQIFFNVSCGTKISCISAMMACMMWECEPYYAKPDYQEIKKPKKITVEKINEIVSIPTYKMITPKSEYLLVLELLEINKGKMKKRHLIEELKKLSIIEPVGVSSLSKPAEHGQLKTILEPMINMEYVTVETLGRNSIVSISIQGKNTLRIFGNPHSLI